MKTNSTSATPRQTENIVRMTVMLGDRKIIVHGRQAWTLAALIDSSDAGCTPITRPAPRWSDYVFKLRAEEIEIETVREVHGGDYSGQHARYVLRSPLLVLERVRAGEAAHAA